jgi:hypothetical protein
VGSGKEVEKDIDFHDFKHKTVERRASILEIEKSDQLEPFLKHKNCHEEQQRKQKQRQKIAKSRNF